MSETTTDGATFDASRLRTVLELRRPVGDRMIAGVCTGLARYLRLDPVVVRVLLATLSVVGGLGLVIYGTVWVLTPQEGSDRAPLGHVDDLATGGTRTVVLVLAAVLAVVALVGPGGWWWGPWPALVVVGVVCWLLLARDRGPGVPAGHPGGAGPGPAPHSNLTAPTDTKSSTDSDQGTTTTELYVGGEGAAPPGAAPPAPPTTPAVPAGPPSGSSPAPRASSRRARRDGGRLTLLALGTVGLLLAGAWIADRAGQSVQAPVVLALALGVVGAAMAAGTVMGNGRPLILPALVLGGMLAIASVLPSWTVGEQVAEPRLAATVDDSYELGVGRQLIDLSDVTDVDGLDGRTLRVGTGVGETVVVVPRGVDVTVDADVGAGELVVFERAEHGPDSDLLYADPDTAAPDLELVLRSELGRIEVERG